ncbi:hypothetical protein A0J61_10319 [Choanephora cucurbitarum]|uniref:Retrotransposon gag domain-containing protein n=1 Tax=Choanephora cucurbitarum TaxID=101091 RepID=A0A1C7MXT4_9FUNG|nr:hypothetical protein A0J61_10319 [Choanephora cucurbitarum]
MMQWFFTHDFEEWDTFKKKYKERFQVTKVNINAIVSSLLSIQRKPNENIRDYIDRFDNLCTKYERARKEKEGWRALDPKVLKDTFIEGLQPRYLRLIVKQEMPRTLNDAQSVALRECDEEDSENDREQALLESYQYPKGKEKKEISKDKSSYQSQNPQFGNKSMGSQDKRQQDIEKKVEDITQTLQRLALLVERNLQSPNSNTVNGTQCYNCQGGGHVAGACQEPCKLCKGQLGDHVFWKCPNYVTNKAQNTYLVMKGETTLNKNETIETYAVEKRGISTDSDRDVRVSRSGKKLKIHDTVPEGVIEAQKRARIQKKLDKINEGDKRQVVTQDHSKGAQGEETRDAHVHVTANQTTALEAKQLYVIPGNTVRAEDVLEAKQYVVSLKQLMPLPGFRSDLFRKTIKKRRVKDHKNIAKPMEVYRVDRTGSVRHFVKGQEGGTGAPRVEAIVAGEMLVDAIMDAGSHCTIVSSKLVKELGLVVKTEENFGGSRMADGAVVQVTGIIEKLFVTVQGVNMCVDAAVFEKPPYDLLLGSDCLELMGLAVDYSTNHFVIKTDAGILPLKVSFDTQTLRMERIQMQDPYISDFDEHSEKEWTSEDETSEGYSESGSMRESYLVIPYHGKASESYLIERKRESEIEVLADTIEDAPTEEAIKMEAISHQVAANQELSEEQRNKLVDILHSFLDVFGLDYNDLKQTNLVQLHIDTGDHQPILKKPNKHMSHAELENFKKELARMLKTGQITPTMHLPNKNGKSSLGWAFPAIP